MKQILKTGTEILRKAKTSVQSYWVRIKPAFKKYGDLLLFVLALGVLIAIPVKRTGGKVTVQTTPPSIVFTQWWQDNLDKKTLLDLAGEFESLHNDIKIIIKDRAYEDLWNDLFNPGENNFPGDVLALDPLWVPDLLKREMIEQCDETPLLSFINVLYYNVEILKEAGFTRPPKNRGEFTNYLMAICAKDKSREGFFLDSNNSRGIYDDVFPWIWSAGAQLIKDGKPSVNSRQVVESLSFLASLDKEDLIFFGGKNVNKLEYFISGRVAFMIAPSSDIAIVRECMGEEAFGISSIPSPVNYAGKAFFASMGWTAGVNSSSVHKEEAQLFLEFLAEKAASLSEKVHAISGNGFPPSAQDPFYSKVWDIVIAAEEAHDFSGLPWTELEEIFNENLSALFAEKITPVEAANEIQESWEKIIK